MIAAGRYGVDVSGSNTRLVPLRYRRDRPGMADRVDVVGRYSQQSSFSFMFQRAADSGRRFPIVPFLPYRSS
jgi:hypothetical protein